MPKSLSEIQLPTQTRFPDSSKGERFSLLCDQPKPQSPLHYATPDILTCVKMPVATFAVSGRVLNIKSWETGISHTFKLWAQPWGRYSHCWPANKIEFAEKNNLKRWLEEAKKIVGGTDNVLNCSLDCSYLEFEEQCGQIQLLKLFSWAKLG